MVYVVDRAPTGPGGQEEQRGRHQRGSLRPGRAIRPQRGSYERGVLF